MAELIIKIGDNDGENGYKDGDVLCAFNSRRIKACHAEMICHVKHQPFNRDGLNPVGSLAQHWFENTHKYKFERISTNEIRRTNLLTLEEDILSNTPNQAGEAMDVPSYIERQVRHERHRIFGSLGNEIWYGGKIDTSMEKIDAVWQKIEEQSPLREIDHRLWPLGNEDKKQFLALPVDDFDDATAVAYESPLMEVVSEDGKLKDKVLRRRNYSVDWRPLLTQRQVQDLEDSSISVDLRGEITQKVRSQIVTAKPEPDFDFVVWEGADLSVKSARPISEVLTDRAQGIKRKDG